jgi:peptidoglycan/xylan/chitin deacetylase (PgdA/CDA1 family)
VLHYYVKKIKNLFEQKAIALMYHRIADLATDPWELAVSPDNFEQQLQVLKQVYKVLSVSDLVNQLKNKAIIKNSVCLTFDDGYYDNFYYAKPLLEKYNCPATFFIPAHYINKKQQFWWDELEHILFNTVKMPLLINLNINNHLFKYQLETTAQTDIQLQKQRLWRWPEPAPTDRCILYLELYKYLKPLSFIDITAVLKEIKLWAGVVPNPDPYTYAMSSLELAQMIKQPLFDIGMHTITHPALAFQTKEVQRAEVIGSREYLSKYERHINVIAYPFGSYNESTLSIMKEQNVVAGFTTDGQVINNNTNHHSLGRFQVKNWNGEEFERQLYKWANG